MAAYTIPPMAKGRIRAVRDMISGLGNASRAARVAAEKALAEYGIVSDEYAEAKARSDEADEQAKTHYTTLKARLDELERPFRRLIH